MAVKRFVFVEELADRFGVDLEVIWQALDDLGLVEFPGATDPIPNQRAESLGVWTGGWRELTGKWSTELLPQLSMVLSMQVSDDDEAQEHKLARRARELANKRLLQESDAERREHEYSQMTGMHRVRAMIDDRTPVLQAQYLDDQWRVELHRQLLIANQMQQEHGFDDSYPDFESELWDRVVFTVDEMVHAALHFEETGRAIATQTQEHPVAI